MIVVVAAAISFRVQFFIVVFGEGIFFRTD
jgi:hypothetical protein